jgi:hypothetical protein
MMEHYSPVQKLRKELRAKIRRRELERRAAKLPLLAEALIAEEIKKRPRYYAGEIEEEKEDGKAL